MNKDTSDEHTCNNICEDRSHVSDSCWQQAEQPQSYFHSNTCDYTGGKIQGCF